MGRRNREAVEEFRREEKLPTFYEQERPDVIARRRYEAQLEAQREGVERTERAARALDLADTTIRSHYPRPPMLRGIPLVALGNPEARPWPAKKTAGGDATGSVPT